jgi:hypothetical protein
MFLIWNTCIKVTNGCQILPNNRDMSEWIPLWINKKPLIFQKHGNGSGVELEINTWSYSAI